MTYNPRFARYTARFLRVVYWVLLLLLVMIVLLGVFDKGFILGFFSAAADGVGLELEKSAYALSAPELGLQSVEVEYVRGELNLEGASTNNLGLTLGIGLLTGAAFGALLYGVHLLVGLFSSIAKGDPFQPKNLYRLRVIGWLSVASYFFDRLWEFVGARFAESFIVGERGVTVIGSFDPFNFLYLETLVFGLGALALAEVFRYALAVQTERDALYEEQSFTV